MFADNIPPCGFLRMSSIIGPNGLIPISRSKWLSGVRSGEFPKPLKFGRASLWRIDDIKRLIESASSGSFR